MYRCTLRRELSLKIVHNIMLEKEAENNNAGSNYLAYLRAKRKALEELYEDLGLDKTYEDEGRYVYGVRIFLENGYMPMAELVFGDGGKPNGETKIVRWDCPDEIDRYVISSYTFIWDERTKDIAYGGSFEEYKNYGN